MYCLHRVLRSNWLVQILFARVFAAPISGLFLAHAYCTSSKYPMNCTAEDFSCASVLPVEIIRYILLSLSPRELISMQTVQFSFDRSYLLPSSSPVTCISRFPNNFMLSSMIRHFGGLCTRMFVSLDHLGHFLGSQPSFSSRTSFTRHDYPSVGLHNP